MNNSKYSTNIFSIESYSLLGLYVSLGSLN